MKVLLYLRTETDWRLLKIGIADCCLRFFGYCCKWWWWWKLLANLGLAGNELDTRAGPEIH